MSPPRAIKPKEALLSGYLGGLIDRDAMERGNGRYRLAQLGWPMLVDQATGERFSITVEQVAGEE